MATWTTGYDNARFRVIATELSTDVATNTSRVQLVAELYSTGQAFNGYPQVLTVKVDGASVANVTGITYSFNSSGTKNLGSWIVTIDRTANPNEVNIQAEISDTGYMGPDGTTAIINQNLTLSSIARESIPSLNQSSVTFGNDVRIYTNRQNLDYAHSITYSIGTKTGTVATNVGTYFDWTPPNVIAEAFPNNLSGLVTLVVTTYNGTTEIGSNSIDLIVNIDTTSQIFLPFAQKPTLLEKNNSIKNNIGNVWVQSQSVIGVTAGAVADYGATVVSGSIILNPGTSEQRITASLNTEFGVLSQDVRLNLSGSYQIAVEVVDSRGLRSVSEAQIINVSAYQSPRLSNVTANRDGDEPTTINIQATGLGSHLTNQNTLTLSAYIRQVGETTWNTDNRVVSNSSSNGSVAINQPFAGYSEALSYEVRLELKDEISSNQVSIITIGTTSVLLDAYKDVGVALGKLYEPEFGGSLQVGEDGLVSFGPMHVENESVMYVQRDSIADGDDLNNLVESGIYTKTNRNTNNPIKNLPSGFMESNMVLNVIKLNDTVSIQWAMQVPASVPTIVNPMKIAVRSKYFNFWNPWQEII